MHSSDKKKTHDDNHNQKKKKSKSNFFVHQIFKKRIEVWLKRGTFLYLRVYEFTEKIQGNEKWENLSYKKESQYLDNHTWYSDSFHYFCLERSKNFSKSFSDIGEIVTVLSSTKITLHFPVSRIIVAPYPSSKNCITAGITKKIVTGENPSALNLSISSSSTSSLLKVPSFPMVELFCGLTYSRTPADLTSCKI